MQWSADTIEHAHVQEIKNPAWMGNNQNYYDQITCHLDHSDKCSRFDLATCLETWEMGMGAASSYNDSDDFDEDKEDEVDDANSLIQQLYPSRSAVNYFSIADSLVCSCTPNVPTPSHTFATTTTTFHIATKPSLHLSVDEAATQFRIPDLCPMIKDFLQWEQDNSSHPVTGIRMQDSQCPLPFDCVQIWYKIHVQQFLYHGGGKVDAPQTLKALPPSTKNPHGLYDAVIVSPDTESDWPLQELEGTTTSCVDLTSNS